MMTDDDIDSRRTHLQRLNVTGGTSGQSQLPASIGVGASNLADLLMASQTKIEKVIADLSDKLAAVEARATFTEKVTMTAEAIVIERQLTLAKDRKY